MEARCQGIGKFEVILGIYLQVKNSFIMFPPKIAYSLGHSYCILVFNLIAILLRLSMLELWSFDLGLHISINLCIALGISKWILLLLSLPISLQKKYYPTNCFVILCDMILICILFLRSLIRYYSQVLNFISVFDIFIYFGLYPYPLLDLRNLYYRILIS